jgi:hypothetical protein
MIFQDISQFEEFLTTFGLDKKKISSITGNKQLYTKFHHHYLLEKGLSGNEIGKLDGLVGITLQQKTHPTRYLLETISKYVSQNRKIEITSERFLLQITYGKLPKEMLSYFTFTEQGYYLIEYQNIPIGIIEYKNQQSITLIHHLGNYLKE